MFSFFTIVITALAIGHTVAYKTFVSIFKDFASRHIFAVRAIFVLVAVSFLGATTLVREHDSIFTEIFYTVTAVWLGFLLYIFLAGILYGLIWIVMHFVAPAVPVVWIGKTLMVVALLVGMYGLYNAHHIKVTELTITLPGLPEAWQGRRAVFVADMHLGQIHGARFAEKVAEKINEINPDIIFDAGDLYDGVAGDAFKLIAPLSSPQPPLGYYFAAGNHEEYGNTGSYREAIMGAGIHALRDEAVEIDGVRIAGAEYGSTRGAQDFRNVLERLPKDPMPTILIKHVPLDLDVAEEEGINLQLSGHTHRAQVFPFNLVTKAVYKGYDYGLKNFGKMQILVTDGVGTWGPPLRVGTHSEIVLITFE